MELKHLDNEQLVDYFAEVWTPDQERMIEAHLAGCEQCSQSARQLYAEIEAFDGWSAQKHREANVRRVVYAEIGIFDGCSVQKRSKANVGVQIEVPEQEYVYAYVSAKAAVNQGGMMVGIAQGMGTFLGRLFTTVTRRQESVAQRHTSAAEYKTREGGQ